MMDVVSATESYERWMAAYMSVVPKDLDLTHRRTNENPFVFLRATPAAARRGAERRPQREAILGKDAGVTAVHSRVSRRGGHTLAGIARSRSPLYGAEKDRRCWQP